VLLKKNANNILHHGMCGLQGVEKSIIHKIIPRTSCQINQISTNSQEEGDGPISNTLIINCEGM
jgi:hypothetical protein